MRCVVITGVSRGLGAALFAELAGRGDRVLGIGRRFTAEQRTLATAEPDRIHLHAADLGDPGALPDTATLAPLLRDGAECVLVHNAAVVEPVGAVGMLDPTEIAAAVAVNITAPMVLTNAFLAARPARAATRVLFISSGAAHRVIDGWAVYSATKRGAETFFDAVAAQMPDAVVVNVNPGVMDTRMQATLRGAEFPERDRFVDLHGRGQLSDPAEVARDIIATHIDRRATRR